MFVCHFALELFYVEVSQSDVNELRRDIRVLADFFNGNSIMFVHLEALNKE